MEDKRVMNAECGSSLHTPRTLFQGTGFLFPSVSKENNIQIMSSKH